jgi:hypothetical protein
VAKRTSFGNVLAADGTGARPRLKLKRIQLTHYLTQGSLLAQRRWRIFSEIEPAQGVEKTVKFQTLSLNHRLDLGVSKQVFGSLSRDAG